MCSRRSSVELAFIQRYTESPQRFESLSFRVGDEGVHENNHIKFPWQQFFDWSSCLHKVIPRYSDDYHSFEALKDYEHHLLKHAKRRVSHYISRVPMTTLRITLNERKFNKERYPAPTINVNKVYLLCIRYIWFGKNVDREQVAWIMHGTEGRCLSTSRDETSWRCGPYAARWNPAFAPCPVHVQY